MTRVLVCLIAGVVCLTEFRAGAEDTNTLTLHSNNKGQLQDPAVFAVFG